MVKRKSIKEYLAESAIELLSRHPVEKVTVTLIARNCGLSTRTFYNNFKDKYDLFLWIYTQKLEEYYQSNLDHMSFRTFIYYSGQILVDYYDFFFNYQQYRGQNHFHQAVFQPLFDFYIRIIREIFHDPVTQEIRESTAFFVLGMLEYVDRFYHRGHLPSLSDTVDVFARAIPENLKKYL
ncbi:hypothetical protein B5F07_08485 [Lachnoclostridium sp. An169]|uniref:TetR/AcrR family transcriptional regulator n=1 Tax=Lachnoclostridium sp. An169 TaxID=1965569 RepID=UPI000B36B7C7|nr:TetR family transcriptional regulator [Lachnoclostridium sp. An169]OUP84164.1 hypothetical protein B5F07_08485 [Lachnoclostridium sp. An169]